ncbi:hypothetical protein [Nocardia shimofusensis]|uniref:hypothetical protein n=1 Tax=Nocardia shimofusensis TaxID=228596 RepID=UPI001FE03562|nr:hypothetical protein [Nocardia shimofusensis]
MQISGSAAVMTDEEGTVSGELDVRLDDSGKGLVRYRGTDTWLTIGNLDGEPVHPWDSVARLAAAIEAGIGRRDAAGNTVPFEVFAEEDPADASLPVDEPQPPGASAPGSVSAAETAGDPSNSPATTPDATTGPSTDSGDATSSAPASAPESSDPVGKETNQASARTADPAQQSSATAGPAVADGGGDRADQDGAQRPDQDESEGPGERPAQG